MKRQHEAILGLGLLALFATGCAYQSSRSASQASTPAGNHPPEVIQFPRQTLIFKPTRDDVTVGCVVFAVGASHRARANGVELAPGQNSIYLKQLATNQFELPALKIEYSVDQPGAIFCLAVKLWFNEVSNQGDSFVYEQPTDRYARVSWCTSPPELFADVHAYNFKAHFGMNRQATLGEFREVLSKSIALNLNQAPLQAEWDYPMINNHARWLSEADMKEVQRLVRERGEHYLIGVSALDSNHVSVAASIGDRTRFHGGHIYKVARRDRTWQIESVVTHSNTLGPILW